MDGFLEEAKIIDEDYTQDGMENLMANLGTEKDKRSHSVFKNKKQLSKGTSPVEIDALYQTDWIAGKVVDIIPEDMTREWRKFNGDIEPETIEQLETEEARLGLQHNVMRAHKWARLYGTAFIVIAVDDGLDPSEPLVIENLREGSLKHIKVIDRHRMSRTDNVETNPLDVNFGMPEKYRLNETSIEIHHTRVLRFDAVELPYQEFRLNNYWSNSVLDRLYEPITNYNTATSSAASMIYNATVDVIKMPDLAGKLMNPNDEATLRKRFALASLMKSFNNMVLLDSMEEWEQKTNSFAGLPDLMDRFAQMVVAATDIPATRFLGTSASGLNATGEGDHKNYFDMLRSKQNTDYRPRLNYFDRIMAKSLGLADDADLRYEFNSLFQMSDKEQADLEFINAQRDAIYVDRSIILESTVAKELRENNTYTNISDEHIKELEEDEQNAGSDDLIQSIGEPTQEPQAQEGEEVNTGEGSEEPGEEVRETTPRTD